jgi:predicted amidophosphoribosyltransferase
LICEELVHLSKAGEVLVLEKNVLVKIEDTEHQARIKDRNVRLKNLAGTFAVKNPELIAKKNIILIDDVTTTGATLNEARRTLKKSGARKVIAFTVAH